MSYKWVMNGTKTVDETPLGIYQKYNTKREAELDRSKYEQDGYIITIAQGKRLADP